MSANTTDQASNGPRRPDDFLPLEQLVRDLVRTAASGGPAPRRRAWPDRPLARRRPHSQITTWTGSGSSAQELLQDVAAQELPDRRAAGSSPSARSATPSSSAASAIDAPASWARRQIGTASIPSLFDVVDRGVEHLQRVVGRARCAAGRTAPASRRRTRRRRRRHRRRARAAPPRAHRLRFGPRSATSVVDGYACLQRDRLLQRDHLAARRRVRRRALRRRRRG